MTGDDARQATDEASGRDYYYNAQTGLTQWEVILAADAACSVPQTTQPKPHRLNHTA
jgi:hypothetical protein